MFIGRCQKVIIKAFVMGAPAQEPGAV